VFELVVFAALGWERRAVTRALGRVEPGDVPRTWRGRLPGGAACLVVQTGIGVDRARAAAGAVGPARGFLVAGCAGGLTDGLATGDLVVADGIVPLDAAGGAGSRLAVDAARLADALAAAGIRAARGDLVSSPVVLATVEAKRAAAACGALVVEMESAAIAAEAARRGIPFHGLRVVLDGVAEAIPGTPALVDATTGDLRARGVAELALRPAAWLTVARLARQSRIAESALHRALVAVLSRPAADATPH
jgi:nucleoside phosphorylase